MDLDRLATWLDAQGLQVDSPLVVDPLRGGTSNVMFLVRRATSPWVLRRPADVAIDRANEGMRREHRILTALEGTDMPHPAPIALCEDHDVLGCTFYLMEYVEGVHPIPLPPAFDDDHHRAEISFAMIDALARLHTVDWRAVGLSDVGRPERFHERQVERWTSQLASYNGRELPGIHQVATWLDGHRPVRYEPTLMHGDFHMRNALIAREPPGHLVAILDWETATIGDPLLDLAGFCEIWCSVAKDGWPTREVLVERYQMNRGLELKASLTYYEVLYNFRLAVLQEGIYQRSLQDPSKSAMHDVGARVLDNVARAVELASSEVP
jgi:aminoglycoside phosphotransferase (APT) family kinase protein